MIESDPYVIAVLIIAVLGFTLLAAKKDYTSWKRRQSGYASGEVHRGPPSMKSIYTVYGTSLASCLFLINNTDAFSGNKVIIIISLFSCLTYLFFLNSWFRNSVFFRLQGRIQKD